MKIALITAAVTLAFAGTAHAGDDKKADKAMKPAPMMQTTMNPSTMGQPEGIAAEKLDGPLITVIPNTRFEVLGAVSRNGQTLYGVPTTQGVFYNHVPAELVDVSTDVDVLDEYSYEYRGMTFTNRVVEGERADPTAALPVIG